MNALAIWYRLILANETDKHGSREENMKNDECPGGAPVKALRDGLQPFVSRKLVVTHPLGGCPIGGLSTDGVVNAQGQVFDTQTGAGSVH